MSGGRLFQAGEKVPVKPPVGECLKQGLLWPKQEGVVGEDEF